MLCMIALSCCWNGVAMTWIGLWVSSKWGERYLLLKYFLRPTSVTFDFYNSWVQSRQNCFRDVGFLINLLIHWQHAVALSSWFFSWGCWLYFCVDFQWKWSKYSLQIFFFTAWVNSRVLFESEKSVSQSWNARAFCHCASACFVPVIFS